MIVPHRYNDRRWTAMPKLAAETNMIRLSHWCAKKGAHGDGAPSGKGGNPSSLRLFLPIRKSFLLPVVVLLRHSFCLTAFSGGRPQQGHRGRTSTSVRARRIRSVAMEFGMWRCDRSGRSSGSVTGGKGRLRASPGAGRS